MNIYQPVCCPPLSTVFRAEDRYFHSKSGKIYYNVAGVGHPLLLVHGVNAGASNEEWKRNFTVLSRSFRVFAIDLPGFGRSEKRPMVYRPEVYTEAIMEFIDQCMGESVYIIASGLSAAYVSMIAYSRPNLIKAFVCVTPSGIRNHDSPPGQTSFTTYGVFTSPIQGDAVYNAFVSKPAIAYFLKEFIYSDPSKIPESKVNYLFQSAHQCPHAKYAPASFVAGFSNLNIAPFFGEIKQPILIIWGALAKLNPIQNLKYYVQRNPNAKTFVFKDTGLVPHEEEWVTLNQVVQHFFYRTIGGEKGYAGEK